jgi:hypothetical protein
MGNIFRPKFPCNTIIIMVSKASQSQSDQDISMTTKASGLAMQDGYQRSVGITTGLILGYILIIILVTEIILRRAITQ